MSNIQEARYMGEFNSSYNYGNDKGKGGDNNLVKFSYKNNINNAEFHGGADGNRDGFNENRENGRKNINNGERYGVIQKRDYRIHGSSGDDGKRYHPKHVSDGAMVNRDNVGNRNGYNNNELHSYTYKKSGNCDRLVDSKKKREIDDSRSPERRNTDRYSNDCEGGSRSYGNNKYDRSDFKVHKHPIVDEVKISKASTETVPLAADRPKLTTQSIGEYKLIRLADGKSSDRWNNPLPNGFRKLSGDSAIATVIDIQPDGPYKVIRIGKHDDEIYKEEEKRITEGASKKIKKPAARYAEHDNFDYHRETLVNQLQNKPKANMIADLNLFEKKQRLIDEVLAAGRKLNMLKIDENSLSEDESA